MAGREAAFVMLAIKQKFAILRDHRVWPDEQEASAVWVHRVSVASAEIRRIL